jgi:hypothetical protein
VLKINGFGYLPTIECYWKHLYIFFGLKVLASSAEKCGFDRWLGRSNDYEINKISEQQLVGSESG